MADPPRPWGLHWRSKPSLIIVTVAIGLFTDLFLYGIVVPFLPFMLQDRLSIPEAQIQSYTSGLLAAYAGAAVLFSLPAGWIADKVVSRQPPFLAGSVLLLVSTSMFAFAQNIAVFVIARLLQGMSAAVVWTTGLAMVQDTVGPGKMGQVLGTIFSTICLGELVAPILGGILYDKAGVTAVFGVATGILAVDIIMRLLVLDKKAIAKYNNSYAGESSNERAAPTRARPGEAEAREDDALLPKNDNEEYRIHKDLGSLTQVVPVLYCFRNPRLLMAMLLSFVQASLMGVFDATVPTEAERLFHFSSLKVGFLFIALVTPYLALGPVAGWAVDRYGTKVAATIGYAFLVPCLALLSVPSQKVLSGESNIILFCVVLALNGVGLSIVGSPGLVEASDVIQKFEAANPGFFGENGPYAQLYGFSSVFSFAGLTVSPLLSGMLKECFGYGVMAVVLAAISGVIAMLSFLIIGENKRRSETVRL